MIEENLGLLGQEEEQRLAELTRPACIHLWRSGEVYAEGYELVV